jgi:hypothetical protein
MRRPKFLANHMTAAGDCSPPIRYGPMLVDATATDTTTDTSSMRMTRNFCAASAHQKIEVYPFIGMQYVIEK